MSLTSAGVPQIPDYCPFHQTNLVTQDPGYLNELMTRVPDPGDYSLSVVRAFDNNVNFDVTTRDVSNLVGRNFVTLPPNPPLYFDSSLSLGSFGSPDFGLPSSSLTTLDQALCHPTNNFQPVPPRPVIVTVASHCPDKSGNFGHHFVLVTAENTDSGGNRKFVIADPYKGQMCKNSGTIDNCDSLDCYGNQFEIRGSVADPSGDVSGLDLAVGGSAELLVTDFSGKRAGFDSTSGSIVNEIPGASIWEDHTNNDETGADGPASRYANILHPGQGTYNVQITGLSLGTYTLQVVPFAQDGSAEPRSFLPGIAGPGSSSSVQIQFASTPGSTSTMTSVATFNSTLQDIRNSRQLGLIDNHRIADSLSRKIISASVAATGGDTEKAADKLEAFTHEVNAETGKHITGMAPQVLLADAASLISELR